MDNIEHAGESAPHANSVPLVTINPPTVTRQISPSTATATPATPASSQQSNSLHPVIPATRARRSPSIRIRRTPSSNSLLPRVNEQSSNEAPSDDEGEWSGRHRSNSAPQRPAWISQVPTNTGAPPMQTIVEGTPNGAPSQYLTPRARTIGRMRSVSNAAARRLSLTPISSSPAVPPGSEREYDSEIVDILDVVDPEISTLSSLTNVQNSLFIPNLGPFLNRRPTYTLTRRPTTVSEVDTLTPFTTATEKPEPEDVVLQAERTRTRTRDRTHSITSMMSESRYAVLPHGVRLDGWTDEEKEELNDHVRHMLHSRREKFKRGMKGFGQYVRKPLGFFVTLYATLITLFGLAWVLFLIGWINVGGRKDYIINVIDNVLVALFAIMGDGLAPFRAVDTYHMIFIAHYYHLTWRLRREKGMPELQDENELPARLGSEIDVESKGEQETSVLTPKQQKRLLHHQTKLANSHTFYKPHETDTHHAFPLRYLVTVVCLLDCHSLFQIALGTCTWAISYHVRPFALTTVILCCSISCNTAGGVTIVLGDRKTRKKDVVERMFRQALTEEAMNRIKNKKTKGKGENDGEQNGESSQSTNNRT